MTVRIYRSTDASAPTLTGQAGSLTTLLDAVLVNGYGSQTAAGWSINQTTTNKRGYLQNTTGSNNPSGMLLYVDDTAPTTAKEARVCGFETMSAITPTGTGQFPTSGQSSIGTGQLVIRKSTTADATARAWTCIANGQSLYFFAETGDQTSPIAAFPFFFGDFFSYKTSDSYAVGIIGRAVENGSSPINDPLHAIGVQSGSATPMTQVCVGCYAARNWTGVGGSVQFGKMIDSSLMGSSGNQAASGSLGNASIAMGRNTSTANFAYPNGSDGALWVSPIRINHSNAIRGYLPGLWAPLHDRPLNHNDTLTVSGGNLNGKSLIIQQIPAWTGGTDVGQVVAETSNTWA
jgi:hypothetical protein